MPRLNLSTCSLSFNAQTLKFCGDTHENIKIALASLLGLFLIVIQPLQIEIKNTGAWVAISFSEAEASEDRRVARRNPHAERPVDRAADPPGADLRNEFSVYHQV